VTLIPYFIDRVAGDGQPTAAGPPVPGGSLLLFFFKRVRGNAGVSEHDSPAHLGGNPDGFHDFLITRAGPAAKLGVSGVRVPAPGGIPARIYLFKQFDWRKIMTMPATARAAGPYQSPLPGKPRERR